MAPQVTQSAVFIGCNRQNYVSDYNDEEQLIAYGASNTVALWRPTDVSSMGTYHTLKKHAKEVTAVRFIPKTQLMVSTGEDGEVNIWKRTGEVYSLHQLLSLGSSSVTCLSVIDDKVFATGSTDGNVVIWLFNGSEFEVAHQFEVKFGFLPTSLALQDVQAGHYVLAIGGTSTQIFIYSFTLNGNLDNFSKSATLPGHEDWIKCLVFATETENKEYVLASGSQDRYIRLWRLKLNDTIDDSDEDRSKLTLLSNKQHKFFVNEARVAFSFDALIMGHDDWITGLRWHPSYAYGGPERKLQLLSSSADTTLMTWEMDEQSGIWVCTSRLGELSIKGASTATGASGGFWSCLWFYNRDTESYYIAANGKTGAFRLYESDKNNDKIYESKPSITGATREVTDVLWLYNGNALMATSLDQTTRIFAPWLRDSVKTWHEFARPQIHGYDMICADIINSVRFVSGGDEKILRVFEITQSVSQYLRDVSGIDVTSTDNLQDFASLPVLGLSNKAAEVKTQDDEEGDAAAVDNNELQQLRAPPLEDYLQRTTLFPEIEKLYGHGYEITSCATNPRGSLIASSCRSNTARHAVIRIFNVNQDYQQSQQVLKAHSLTITNLEFSLDGRYLLAVSRDRSYSLWKVEDEKLGTFTLEDHNERAHSRIIWDCGWVGQNDFGNFFFTASRDRNVKLWSVSDNVTMEQSIKFSQPITSVTSVLGNDKRILYVAAGLESGAIEIFSIDLSESAKGFRSVVSIDSSLTPSGKINRIRFCRPYMEGSHILLGVGSSDNSTRIYGISV